MKRIFIIGHRQPDLDAIVAPIAYAELLKVLGQKNAIPVRCDQVNNETRYIFEKFSISIPKLIKKKDLKKSDQVILIDHNEESQRLEGLNPDQIIGIIDHRKANLNLNKPIKIDIRPWGSSSTIVYEYFKQNNLQPEPKTAKLMLAAILSDTLGLKSPTTTDFDRKTAKELAKQTGIDVRKLTLEQFKAKSDISNLTPKQVVTVDYKIFNFGGERTLINQIETVEQKKVLKMIVQLIKAMGEVKIKQKLDHIYCVITDILKANSQLIYLNEEDRKIVESAFGGRGENNVLDIGPRLSRKKQIAPEIEKVLTS
jgi:manganese-dependent inorganic pyrophosphatase